MPTGQKRFHHIVTKALLLCASFQVTGGCQPGPMADPLCELATPGRGNLRHMAAMEQLDTEPRDPEAHKETLHSVLWAPGYGVPVREAALHRLEQHDPSKLHASIAVNMPRVADWKWLVRVSEIIAERNWKQHTPALIQSWSRPTRFVDDDLDRPEYLALASMYGEEAVVDIVFDAFRHVGAPMREWQALRARCWELLHRLGHRDRLLRLLQETEPAQDDLLLRDLRQVARELGLVPHNREEIIWARQLLQPEYERFRHEAASAISQLHDEARSTLALRDLAVIVSAARHDPDLFAASHEALYAGIEAYLRRQRRHFRIADNINRQRSERLSAWRNQLTWGDLAAMKVAVRALGTPAVAEHLFDYADRDLEDTTTEYGGLIKLDMQGRFEVLEFPPRIRKHDQMFVAPTEMFDQSYTALFHFHFHAQRYRNGDYAGPGEGDLEYADSARANCLVMTFINRGTMNVDFYRHGEVVVDLGEIHRLK